MGEVRERAHSAAWRWAGDCLLITVLAVIVYGPSLRQVAAGHRLTGSEVEYMIIASLFATTVWMMRSYTVGRPETIATGGHFLTAWTPAGRRTVDLDAIATVRLTPSSMRYNFTLPDWITLTDRHRSSLSFTWADAQTIRAVRDALRRPANDGVAVSEAAMTAIGVLAKRVCRDRSNFLRVGGLWLVQVVVIGAFFYFFR